MPTQDCSSLLDSQKSHIKDSSWDGNDSKEILNSITRNDSPAQRFHCNDPAARALTIPSSIRIHAHRAICKHPAARSHRAACTIPASSQLHASSSTRPSRRQASEQHAS